MLRWPGWCWGCGLGWGWFIVSTGGMGCWDLLAAHGCVLWCLWGPAQSLKDESAGPWFWIREPAQSLGDESAGPWFWLVGILGVKWGAEVGHPTLLLWVFLCIFPSVASWVSNMRILPFVTILSLELLLSKVIFMYFFPVFPVNFWLFRTTMFALFIIYSSSLLYM